MVATDINVIKRDGTVEAFDLEKFHKVCQWACEGITGVSPSTLELKTGIQFHDKIKTAFIMDATIKAAADLISEETPNYQYVASRLINFKLRKEVYNHHLPCSIFAHVNHVVDQGFYDKKLLEWYSEDDYKVMDTFINHERDFNIVYVGMEQWRGKYLVKNRITKQIYETPQMAYMLIAATLFHDYPVEARLKWVKNYYDAISLFDISLPTPILAGVRTPQRQFASCVLVSSDDSLDSINATASAVVKYAAQKAGLGIGASRIRAINSPVRNGDTAHTGVVPFIKYFQAALKSCAQGGIRMSSGTLNLLCWHLEIEDLLVLKNNKGIEENRARHLDYCIHFSRLFYERLVEGKNITLFSPHDVPEVYKAFYENQDLFKELYEKAERNTRLRKKSIPAVELFSKFLQERKDTGRVYLMNVDHANDHSSFRSDRAHVEMTNLCVEITLPTKPLTSIEDEDAEIATCILSAVNWGRIREPKDFERVCTLAVRGLDAIIDYQHYPVKAAANFTLNRRALGVGIINLAYWLARNDLNYSSIDSDGLAKVHEFAEAWSYYLIKASVDLAREKGPCQKYQDTKYYQGIFPINTYKREVEELVKPVYYMDWKTLHADLLTYGIRNSSLMALMPAESSAQLSNATNGIEPPRALVSIKQSRDGVLKQVVPEYRRMKNKYDLLWDQKNCDGYIKICAVLQKFIDQSISLNLSYNPKYYDEEKIPMSELFRHMLMCYRYGIKTLYYCNVNDGAGEVEVKPETKPVINNDTGSDSQDESDCSACKI